MNGRSDKSADIYIPDRKIRVEVKSGKFDGFSRASFGGTKLKRESSTIASSYPLNYKGLNLGVKKANNRKCAILML